MSEAQWHEHMKRLREENTTLQKDVKEYRKRYEVAEARLDHVKDLMRDLKRTHRHLVMDCKRAVDSFVETTIRETGR